MLQVIEAIYEDGVLKPSQLLPLNDHERVKVTIQRAATRRHSVLDIPVVSLGEILSLPSHDDDLLGEMLEERE